MSRALIETSNAGHDLESLKSRLREVRESALREQETLVQQFRHAVRSYSGMRLLSARHADHAAAYVRQAAHGTDNVVINRSSVVANELRPALEREGFRIIHPYFAEFESFEPVIRDYWDLPDLLGKGIVGNLGVSEQRLVEPAEGDVRDCVAVLGVNAAAAADGSIYFLQHYSNISQSLLHARQVFLVVALDKLVPDAEAAALQTSCMGIFGLETMLLNLRGAPDAGHSLTSLPAAGVVHERPVHVVLLDNGRSQMLQGGYRDLLLCIGCKACSRQCPINRSMTRDGSVWSPRDYLFMFLLDDGRSMDACLHCEACRGECPLSIDLPRLMWKAQADRASRRGRSLRDRMLGNPEFLARLGSLAAPVSNRAAGTGLGKAVIGRALGLDSKRTLPRFQRSTFVRQFSKRPGGGGSRGRVAYYAGCFANYYEPEVSQALVRVMERNGFEVAVPDQKCCGLPMMASKNVEGARENAEYNIACLASMVAGGYDVITACPSCSLMIKREYPNLFDSDAARLVSEHTYYVDEYLMGLYRSGALDTAFGPISTAVLYHVPCHLKVQDMVSDSLELLRLIPGLSIEKVNTACCGMGGYHGYRVAHSALSMEIGARLFGEIGSLSPGSRVVTGCAACRLQIEAGTGVHAEHPMLLLQEAYGTGRAAHGRTG